jgi:hypothetical protein
MRQIMKTPTTMTMTCLDSRCDGVRGKGVKDFLLGCGILLYNGVGFGHSSALVLSLQALYQAALYKIRNRLCKT